MSLNTRWTIVAVLSLSLVFVLGFLIGYFTSPSKSSDTSKVTNPEKDRFKDHDTLYSSLDANKLKEYLK